MSRLKRVAIFFSGQGGGAENLIKSSFNSNLYTVPLLISSNPHAHGVSRLAPFNVPIRIVSWGKESNNSQVSAECFQICDDFQIDVICLAGWLKQLVLPEKWTGRVLNIHPSLLPLFGGKGMYGLRVHKAVLESRLTTSGCTVHLIDNDLDRGQILGQSALPIDSNDTPETLQAKIYKLELQLYPQVLNTFLSS